MSEAEFIASLSETTTTRARCWRVTRLDGMVLGFTDHDRALTFDGTQFEAQAALTPSEATATLGLSIDEQQARGALSSSAITDPDLAVGLYDGAQIDVFDVDWTQPANRMLIGRYLMGEVRRGDQGFEVELVSRTAELTKRTGRRFLATCDAQPGDARCGVNLNQSQFRGNGAVESAAPGTLIVTGLASYSTAWFARGVLTWVTGSNSGTQSEVRGFTKGGSTQVINLWRAPLRPITGGDTFTITAGCDKTYRTCQERFDNGDRFRGFPHMPPESFPAEYATQGDPALDGGSRFG